MARKGRKSSTVLQITEGQLTKIKREASHHALVHAIKLVLYILVDKHGGSREEVTQLAREIEWAAQGINEGKLSWSFVDRVLDELGVEIVMR